MGISSHEDLKEVARQFVALAYDAREPLVAGLEENHHPTRGSTMVKLTDAPGRLFTVTVLPNCAIVIRDLTEDTDD